MRRAGTVERRLIDETIVDDFRALVARLGIMSTVSSLYGGEPPCDGVELPNRPIRLHHCTADGSARWLLVAGSSDADPWAHVDTAPLWVQERYDMMLRPGLVAWGSPTAWEVSDGRRVLEHDGVLPVVDIARPWLTDGIRTVVRSALSDGATIAHLGEILPSDEPDVRADADIPALSVALWNALTSPAITNSPERLAGSLRASATHVRLHPVTGERISKARARVDLLWRSLLPEQDRPVGPVDGPLAVTPRRGDMERQVIARNTALLRGWATAAMAEAARQVPLAERRFGFDERGLSVRDGSSWARLIGFSEDRLAIVGDGPARAPHSSPASTRPGWLPDLSEFGGTVAWTVRGYWRGDRLTGPLETIPEFAALAAVKPDREPNLAAALARVPEPVGADARDEVLGMMRGLQDFTWSGAILAASPPFGGALTVYPFEGRVSRA
ncbi:hypothetical protein EJO69_08535 [Flaviflexus salsibiostraticola]|uniref:Uncharacterized protein n=1 Tax=Flaviflexus salsibiostraticola TaxID=1282737 RepID=A0A3S8ZA53_9ACTO|nr:hypothetical protein [Flaviflexus salsibiostraticola]AZN30346.1 hypothetical protein EJO69_08535 [Flaviflexus salsibiostraticola]